MTERTDASTASSFLDNDELERTGIDLGTTGRLQLMARLAEGKKKKNLIWFIVLCDVFINYDEAADLMNFFKALVCRSPLLHSRLFR